MDALEAMSMFDWISPMVSMAESLSGWDGLVIENANGYTGREITRLLKRGGVKVGKAPMIVSGVLLVNVKDADKAREVLAQYGVAA